MTDYLNRRQYFEIANVAPVFNELTFWASHFGALLLDNLQVRRGSNILDVGTATGFPLFELAGRYGPSCKLTGIDVWKEALEQARLKQRTYNISNVEIIEADAAAMPFEDAMFDLIVSNLGVNNFDNPTVVLAECYRVLKPGGRLALTTNIKGHWQEFYGVFRAVLEATGNREYLERLAAHQDHRGTRQSVSALLEGAGFGVSRLVEDSFRMRFDGGSALFNHTLTQLGFLDAWRAIVEPSDEEEIFAELERQLNELAEAHGELALTTPMLYVEGEKA